MQSFLQHWGPQSQDVCWDRLGDLGEDHNDISWLFLKSWGIPESAQVTMAVSILLRGHPWRLDDLGVPPWFRKPLNGCIKNYGDPYMSMSISQCRYITVYHQSKPTLHEIGWRWPAKQFDGQPGPGKTLPHLWGDPAACYWRAWFQRGDWWHRISRARGAVDLLEIDAHTHALTVTHSHSQSLTDYIYMNISVCVITYKPVRYKSNMPGWWYYSGGFWKGRAHYHNS